MSFFEIYAVIQWFIIGIIFLNFAASRYFSSQEVMNEFLECSMCSPMNVFFSESLFIES
ncbi:hypothetical protein SAMN05660380_01719 [Xylella fastidiosa]|nr:hypothetical protein SAMN05660380_01719 [Xylella fastidiosa]